MIDLPLAYKCFISKNTGRNSNSISCTF